MIDLAACSWPIARAGEAMQELAARAGLRHRRAELPDPPGLLPARDRAAARTWIRAAAACLDIEAEPAAASYGTLGALLRSGPALLQIRVGDELRVLAVLESRCITPALNTVRADSREIRSALAEQLEKGLAEGLGRILHGAGVTGKARGRVFDAMLEERLGNVPLAEVWLLALPPSAGLFQQLRQAGIGKQVGIFLGANALEYTLWIVAWILAGRWALAGRFDMGWLLAWGLVLLTIAPLHTLAAWNQAKLAITSSWLMMRMLLEGSFRLDPEDVRGQGAGQLLGRVLDTEALHTLALTGGLTGLIALLQLLAAAALLVLGADAPWIAILLAAWIALTLVLGWMYYRRRREWTAARVNLTSDTSERMAGHRTRIAQQRAENWHRGEDGSLAGYVERSRNVDRLAAVFVGVLPKAWLMAGIAAMAHGVVTESVSAAFLTAQLGGILLAHNSLRALGASLASLSGAAISLERVRDLLAASKKVETPGDPAIAVAMASPSSRPLLAMRDVSYRYPGRSASAVTHATVAIEERDRVLVQGASGSGKSTWGVAGERISSAGIGTAFPAGHRSQNAGRPGVAKARCLGAAISRKLHAGKQPGLQSVDGPRVASGHQGSARGRTNLPRIGAWPLARFDAGGADADGGRDRLAIIQRREEPGLPGARAAATGGPHGSGRDLCGTRSRDSASRHGLRATPGPVVGLHRARLTH